MIFKDNFCHVLRLHDAYHAEISIILENELLQRRYSSNNPETFRQAVRGDRLPNTDPEAQRIADIVDYALSRVIARFLNQDYAKMEPIRKIVLKHTGQTIDTLRQQFEEAMFFSTPPQTAHKWCHTYLRPIELTISPLWQKIGIRRHSLAEALLYGHFAEIIFNAFKYADHTADWFLRITFREQEINKIQYLTICWENPRNPTNQFDLGSKQGLAAITEDLQQLNGSTNPETTLYNETTEHSFKLYLHYQSDLLYAQSLPTINMGALLLAGKQTNSNPGDK
ncbi:hypothetical protein TI05_08595 [Achromatium sp. WMS3]|nr:hypothetical protein TI05_08595 [Achromatium sp. WMS3]